MTKHEMTWPEPISGFDPVQCKREAHAQMDRETEGMTREEVLEYFRKISEETRKRRAEYRAAHGLDN